MCNEAHCVNESDLNEYTEQDIAHSTRSAIYRENLWSIQEYNLGVFLDYFSKCYRT